MRRPFDLVLEKGDEPCPRSGESAHRRVEAFQLPLLHRATLPLCGLRVHTRQMGEMERGNRYRCSARRLSCSTDWPKRTRRARPVWRSSSASLAAPSTGSWRTSTTRAGRTRERARHVPTRPEALSPRQLGHRALPRAPGCVSRHGADPRADGGNRVPVHPTRLPGGLHRANRGTLGAVDGASPGRILRPLHVGAAPRVPACSSATRLLGRVPGARPARRAHPPTRRQRGRASCASSSASASPAAPSATRMSSSGWPPSEPPSSTIGVRSGRPFR